MADRKTGGCECGAVRFASDGPWRDVVFCHCEQCRRTSGHYWAATAVPREALEITADNGLVWRQSSELARRGFCSKCGSSLFYERDGAPHTSIGAGTLDAPTSLSALRHIWVDSRADYYELDDDLPKEPRQ